MAFGMKHWLGLAVAGCALVAIHELPPRTMEYGSRPAPTPTMTRVQRLTADVYRTEGLYQRLRWADSLPALLAADARDGVAVGGPPQLGDSVLAAIRDRVAAERAQMGPLDPEMLFGYYVQPAEQDAPSGLRGVPYQSSFPETMAGTVDGRPYCASVAVVDGAQLSDAFYVKDRFMSPNALGSWRAFLGACRPFLRFGLPGPRIAAWLKRGGISFAEGGTAAATDEAVTFYSTPKGHTLMAIAQLHGAASGESWASRWTIPGPDLPLDRCLAGRADACLQLALHEPASRLDAVFSDATDSFIADRSPFYRVGGAYTAWVFGYTERYLLADLQQQFGPAAFQRFWTSDEDVPTAFHDAFGVDMGTWLVRWTRANLYTYRAGPSLPRSAAFGGFILLVLCGAIAGRWATKRRVA